MAPSASHVASRATASPVEQLDLFALLAPRVARLGTAPPRPKATAAPRREALPTWPFENARPLVVEAAEATAQSGALTASVFDAYRPSVRVPGACSHPTRLVESAAMAAATAPPCDYRPMLPAHLVTQGILSDAQLETVCRAGGSHAEHLPGENGESGPRQGFFLGDGTGVGKGRQSAAIILDNVLQGRHRALWVSENRNLMRDAVRDWTALGGPADFVFRPRRLQGTHPAGGGRLLRELRHAQGQAPRERRGGVGHRPAGAGRRLARRWGGGGRLRGRRRLRRVAQREFSPGYSGKSRSQESLAAGTGRRRSPRPAPQLPHRLRQRDGCDRGRQPRLRGPPGALGPGHPVSHRRGLRREGVSGRHRGHGARGEGPQVDGALPRAVGLLRRRGLPHARPRPGEPPGADLRPLRPRRGRSCSATSRTRSKSRRPTSAGEPGPRPTASSGAPTSGSSSMCSCR